MMEKLVSVDDRINESLLEWIRKLKRVEELINKGIITERFGRFVMEGFLDIGYYIERARLLKKEFIMGSAMDIAEAECIKEDVFKEYSDKEGYGELLAHLEDNYQTKLRGYHEAVK